MKNIIKNIDNFIFDLDGTILNSSKEVLKCIKIAYEETNIPVDYSRITPNVIGPPLRGIFKLISPEIKDESLIDKLEESYSNHYDYSENDETTMYEGMFELLTTLNNKDKKLFIATNKPKKATFRLVKLFNLSFFQDIYTIDKYDNHDLTKKEMIKEIIEKHSLNESKTIMIGDSMHDSISGKENNIHTIGVLWGYGNDKKPLIKHSDYIISSTKELKEII